MTRVKHRLTAIVLAALASLAVVALEAALIWPSSIARARGLDAATAKKVGDVLAAESCILLFELLYFFGQMAARVIGDATSARLLKADASIHLPLIHVSCGMIILACRTSLISQDAAPVWQSVIMIVIGSALLTGNLSRWVLRRVRKDRSGKDSNVAA